MTKVVVDSGICGFAATVQARRVGKQDVGVDVACGCEQVEAFAAAIALIPWKRAFGRMCDTVVYQAASRHLRHATCPIPMAVIKAIEVEVRAALPRDVALRFVEAPDIASRREETTGTVADPKGLAGAADPAATERH